MTDNRRSLLLCEIIGQQKVVIDFFRTPCYKRKQKQWLDFVDKDQKYLRVTKQC